MESSTVTDSSTADALTKYKNIAYKLKKVLESTQIELKEKTAQLNALQDTTTAENRPTSLLSELANYYETLSTEQQQQPSSSSPSSCAVSIVARIPFLNHTWLLLICPTDGRTEWRDEQTILHAYPSLTTVITNTPVWVNPQERQTLVENTKEAQEQLRVFRVRAEALLRQRDTELASLKHKLQQNRTDQIIGNTNNSHSYGDDNNPYSDDPDGDTRKLGTNTTNTPTAIDKLLRIQADLRERECKAKETIQSLVHDLTKTQEQLLFLKNKYNLSHEDVPPTLLTSSVLPSTPTVSSPSTVTSAFIASSSPVSSSSSSSSISSSLTIDQLSVKKIEEEYTAYRKRAVGIIKQRDEQIEKLNEEIEELRNKLRNQQYLHQQQQPAQTGITSPSSSSLVATNPLTPSHSSSLHSIPSSSPFSPGVSGMMSPTVGSIDAKLQYLRKLLVKYLSSTDPSVRLSLETAIMAVAELSPADVLLIKRVQQENDPATAVVAAVSSAADLVGGWLTSTGLFGGGSGGSSNTSTGTVPSINTNTNGGLMSPASSSSLSTTLATPGAQRQLQFTTLKQ